jgi:hypothetical protein
VCTIHQTQGLIFYRLTFDPSGVTKHGLTYIAIFQICSKKTFIFTFSIVDKDFQVDTFVQEEMHYLKTTTQYEITIASLKSYHKKIIIIQSLNIHSFKLYFQNILNDPNLFSSHILCLNETKIQNIQTHQEIFNAISNKFKINSCYDQHGTMISYDTNMFLSHTFSKNKFKH